MNFINPFFFTTNKTIFFFFKKKKNNIYCEDQFWLGPKIGLGFSPISPNNKFVERGRKKWSDYRKEITIVGDLEELNAYKIKRLFSA